MTGQQAHVDVALLEPSISVSHATPLEIGVWGYNYDGMLLCESRQELENFFQLTAWIFE